MSAAGANSAKSSRAVDAIDSYPAVVVGGQIELSGAWVQKLTDYVRKGGVVVFNAAQTKGLPADMLGIKSLGATAEADTARCLSPGEQPQDLSGQMFRYAKLELKGAKTLIATPSGDPLVTVNKLGKGSLVFSALPDLLGTDDRTATVTASITITGQLLRTATDWLTDKPSRLPSARLTRFRVLCRHCCG